MQARGAASSGGVRAVQTWRRGEAETETDGHPVHAYSGVNPIVFNGTFPQISIGWSRGTGCRVCSWGEARKESKKVNKEKKEKWEWMQYAGAPLGT